MVRRGILAGFRDNGIIRSGRVHYHPTHRLVVSVVPGKRTAEKTDALVKDVHRRTGGRMLDLLVSDEYPAYKPAILHTYGETITPPRTGKRGRPKKPYTVAPAGLLYATVHKTRYKVVSLNFRDETHPTSETGARWYATDPGMLPRRGKRAVRGWSRHDR
jgi:hypothetical protein